MPGDESRAAPAPVGDDAVGSGRRQSGLLSAGETVRGGSGSVCGGVRGNEASASSITSLLRRHALLLSERPSTDLALFALRSVVLLPPVGGGVAGLGELDWRRCGLRSVSTPLDDDGTRNAPAADGDDVRPVLRERATLLPLPLLVNLLLPRLVDAFALGVVLAALLLLLLLWPPPTPLLLLLLLNADEVECERR